MLVEKKDSKEIYAMKSIRKEEIIDKEQIEHTKTEKMIFRIESILFVLMASVYMMKTEGLFKMECNNEIEKLCTLSSKEVHSYSI